MATVESEIRAVLEDQVKGLYDKDAQRVLSHRAEDLVSFDLAPPLEHLGEDVRSPDHLETWFGTWDGPIRVDITDLSVEAGGDIAFARAINRMRGTKKGGDKVDFWFRATACFRREDGEWKIVHEHNSVPMKMDGSGKAAVDLTP